jgi:hypothetical protein
MIAQTNDITQNLTQKVPKEELYGLTADTSLLFSDHKGVYSRQIESHQRKLLAKLSFLAPYLEPGERILLIISGCSPATLVEQLLTGILLQPLKRSLFAITNRRILHVPVTWDLKHRFSVAQILYTDCRRIRLGWATLAIKYKSGKVERFRGIGVRGRKKARTLLNNVSFKGRSGPAMERLHLCPACTKPLIKDYYACPNCSLKFKSKGWATLLSIIFPGGGYFYVRHPVVGLLAAVMESITILLLAAGVVMFSLSSPSAPRSIYQAIILCALVLGFQKLVTALFSSKCIEEFIPIERQVEVKIDQSASRRPSSESEGPPSGDWRSM